MENNGMLPFAGGQINLPAYGAINANNVGTYLKALLENPDIEFDKKHLDLFNLYNSIIQANVASGKSLVNSVFGISNIPILNGDDGSVRAWAVDWNSKCLSLAMEVVKPKSKKRWESFLTAWNILAAAKKNSGKSEQEIILSLSKPTVYKEKAANGQDMLKTVYNLSDSYGFIADEFLSIYNDIKSNPDGWEPIDGAVMKRLDGIAARFRNGQYNMEDMYYIAQPLFSPTTYLAISVGLNKSGDGSGDGDADGDADGAGKPAVKTAAQIEAEKAAALAAEKYEIFQKAIKNSEGYNSQPFMKLPYITVGHLNWDHPENYQNITEMFNPTGFGRRNLLTNYTRLNDILDSYRPTIGLDGPQVNNDWGLTLSPEQRVTSTFIDANFTSAWNKNIGDKYKKSIRNKFMGQDRFTLELMQAGVIGRAKAYNIAMSELSAEDMTPENATALATTYRILPVGDDAWVDPLSYNPETNTVQVFTNTRNYNGLNTARMTMADVLNDFNGTEEDFFNFVFQPIVSAYTKHSNGNKIYLKKLGGQIIKAAEGTGLSLKDLRLFATKSLKDLRLSAIKYSELKSRGTDEEHALEKLRQELIGTKFTDAEYTRMAALVADLSSAILSFFPGAGTAASLLTGLAGTGLTVASDILAGFSIKDIAKNLGLGLFWNIVGLIPGVKFGKTLSKTASNARLIARFLVNTVPGGYAMMVNNEGAGRVVNKMLDNRTDEITRKDFIEFASFLQGLMGSTKNAVATGRAVSATAGAPTSKNTRVSVDVTITGKAPKKTTTTQNQNASATNALATNALAAGASATNALAAGASATNALAAGASATNALAAGASATNALAAGRRRNSTVRKTVTVTLSNDDIRAYNNSVSKGQNAAGFDRLAAIAAKKAIKKAHFKNASAEVHSINGVTRNAADVSWWLRWAKNKDSKLDVDEGAMYSTPGWAAPPGYWNSYFKTGLRGVDFINPLLRGYGAHTTASALRPLWSFDPIGLHLGRIPMEGPTDAMSNEIPFNRNGAKMNFDPSRLYSPFVNTERFKKGGAVAQSFQLGGSPYLRGNTFYRWNKDELGNDVFDKSYSFDLDAGTLNGIAFGDLGDSYKQYLGEPLYNAFKSGDREALNATLADLKKQTDDATKAFNTFDDHGAFRNTINLGTAIGEKANNRVIEAALDKVSNERGFYVNGKFTPVTDPKAFSNKVNVNGQEYISIGNGLYQLGTNDQGITTMTAISADAVERLKQSLKNVQNEFNNKGSMSGTYFTESNGIRTQYGNYRGHNNEALTSGSYFTEWSHGNNNYRIDYKEDPEGKGGFVGNITRGNDTIASISVGNDGKLLNVYEGAYDENRELRIENALSKLQRDAFFRQIGLNPDKDKLIERHFYTKADGSDEILHLSYGLTDDRINDFKDSGQWDNPYNEARSLIQGIVGDLGDVDWSNPEDAKTKVLEKIREAVNNKYGASPDALKYYDAAVKFLDESYTAKDPGEGTDILGRTSSDLNYGNYTGLDYIRSLTLSNVIDKAHTDDSRTAAEKALEQGLEFTPGNPTGTSYVTLGKPASDHVATLTDLRNAANLFQSTKTNDLNLEAVKNARVDVLTPNIQSYSPSVDAHGFAAAQERIDNEASKRRSAIMDSGMTDALKLAQLSQVNESLNNANVSAGALQLQQINQYQQNADRVNAANSAEVIRTENVNRANLTKNANEILAAQQVHDAKNVSLGQQYTGTALENYKEYVSHGNEVQMKMAVAQRLLEDPLAQDAQDKITKLRAKYETATEQEQMEISKLLMHYLSIYASVKNLIEQALMFYNGNVQGWRPGLTTNGDLATATLLNMSNGKATLDKQYGIVAGYQDPLISSGNPVAVGYSKKGGSFERERLKLAREKFEHTKRRNHRKDKLDRKKHEDKMELERQKQYQKESESLERQARESLKFIARQYEAFLRKIR